MAVMEPDERPVRCQLGRLERPAWMVADHQRAAAPSEELVHRGLEPALVAELEAVALGWELAERLREQLVVALEVRWQLPDDRSELSRVDQRLHPLVVALDPLADVPEPPHVREVA